MKIATGVEMLEISAHVMGKIDTLHPTLFWNNDGVLLVDTGYPGQLHLFRKAVEQAGVEFDRIKTVLITHQDLDHIGSLPSILNELPQRAKVLASQIEKPYIQGEQRLIKLTPEAVAQAEKMIPANVPVEWKKAFLALLENPPKATVDDLLEDGQEIPIAGGVTVIFTPGHTPGHVSLYHKQSKTLIAADALNVVDGQLFGPDPQYCSNIEEAIHSLKRLAEYEIESIICYHGGLYRGNVNERIAEIIETTQ